MKGGTSRQSISAKSLYTFPVVSTDQFEMATEAKVECGQPLIDWRKVPKEQKMVKTQIALPFTFRYSPAGECLYERDVTVYVEMSEASVTVVNVVADNNYLDKTSMLYEILLAAIEADTSWCENARDKIWEEAAHA